MNRIVGNENIINIMTPMVFASQSLLPARATSSRPIVIAGTAHRNQYTKPQATIVKTVSTDSINS
jgi:hypothetical protein